MRSPELQGYLRSVSKHLPDLGLLERWRLLRALRMDILELAEGDQRRPPTEEEVGRAVQSMPDASETAAGLRATLLPNLALARASFGMGVTIGVITVAVGVFFLLIALQSLQYWAAAISSLLVVPVLILAGTATLLVYASALRSPVWASPRRYGVLPAAAICLFVVAALILVAGAVTGLPWYLPWAAFVIVFVGGTNTLAHATRQLPRLAAAASARRRRRDYFASVEAHLGELDLLRRRQILTELRDHVLSAGVDVVSLPQSERFEAIEGVLGPATDLAKGYLDEMRQELSPSTRLVVKGDLGIGAVAVAAAGVLLAIGLASAALEDTVFTLLGLMGSAGLLAAGLGVLANGLQVLRAPSRWQDRKVPLVALGLVTALILTGVVAAAPSGGLLQPYTERGYQVVASFPLENGESALFWREHPEKYLSQEGPPDAAWVSRLNAGGSLVETVPFPWPPYARVLDLAYENGTWTALTADAMRTWGALERFVSLDEPSWYKVDGHLDPAGARVAWARYLPGALLVDAEIRSSFSPTPDTRWERSVPLSDLVDLEVRVGPGGLLAVATVHDTEATYSRSGLQIYLFDDAGSAVVSTTLEELNVTWTGPQDPFNGTSATLYDVHAVDDAFWILGFSSIARNGTGVKTTWAIRVDAGDLSIDTWELHRHEGPVVGYSLDPGERDSHPSVQASLVSGERLFVLTAWSGWVVNETGYTVAEPGLGGLYLTSLQTAGGIDYGVRLDDASLDGWPIVPRLAAWQGIPRVVGLRLGPTGPHGTQSLVTYTPNSPELDWDRRILTISQPKAYLLYWSFDGEHSGAIGIGSSTSLLPGTTLLEDKGLLDWRAHIGGFNPLRAMLEAPAVLRVDGDTGSSDLVVLARPSPRPDAFAALLVSAALAVSAVLALVMGYPYWRLRHAKNEVDRNHASGTG